MSRGEPAAHRGSLASRRTLELKNRTIRDHNLCNRRSDTCCPLHQVATWCTSRPDQGLPHAPGGYLVHLSARIAPSTCTRWLLGASPNRNCAPQPAPSSYLVHLAAEPGPSNLRQVASWCTSQPEKGLPHAPSGYLVRPPTGPGPSNLHQLATWCTSRRENRSQPAPTSLSARAAAPAPPHSLQKSSLRSARFSASHLRTMLCTWVFTVPTETTSASAICWLVRPASTSPGTSRSRAVRP